VVIEGMNARNIAPNEFPVLFDLATIDVIFISLKLILPAVRQCISNQGEVVALVKPQFEVGRGEVGRGGIVKDPSKHRRVLIEIKEAAESLGLRVAGIIESPILGAEGNREFLIHLTLSKEAPEPDAIIERIIETAGPPGRASCRSSSDDIN
jgi:23S rRNA (cytidine1920-2'-O)/16S rRNA (cytidine1409-2'-O)-methyltransferase